MLDMKDFCDQRRWKSDGMIFLGNVLPGFGANLFFIPFKLVTGGLGGIATLLYHADRNERPLVSGGIGRDFVRRGKLFGVSWRREHKWRRYFGEAASS
jgi:hypothetical protein